MDYFKDGPLTRISRRTYQRMRRLVRDKVYQAKPRNRDQEIARRQRQIERGIIHGNG